MTGSNHKIPVSNSYIIERFGPTAFETQSGECIVTISDTKVCKCPLLPRCLERLLVMMLDENLPARVTRFLVPEELLGDFYVYEKLCPPLNLDAARATLKDLTMAVILGLKELHGHIYAHCDVRLENICCRADGMRVLIDSSV